MLTIKQLDHVVLRVTDLQAMMRFYTEVIGCPVEKIQENLGLYQLRAGSSLIDLVPLDGPLGQKGGAPPGIEGRNMDHFCLQVEPFDADFDHRASACAWIRSGPSGIALRRQGPGTIDLCHGPGRQCAGAERAAGPGALN